MSNWNRAGLWRGGDCICAGIAIDVNIALGRVQCQRRPCDGDALRLGTRSLNLHGGLHAPTIDHDVEVAARPTQQRSVGGPVPGKSIGRKRLLQAMAAMFTAVKQHAVTVQKHDDAVAAGEGGKWSRGADLGDAQAPGEAAAAQVFFAPQRGNFMRDAQAVFPRHGAVVSRGQDRHGMEPLA